MASEPSVASFPQLPSKLPVLVLRPFSALCLVEGSAANFAIALPRLILWRQIMCCDVERPEADALAQWYLSFHGQDSKARPLTQIGTSIVWQGRA